MFFKKLVRPLALLLLVAALAVLLGAVGLSVYARRNVSYALDDALFACAHEESVIRLYGREGENGPLVLAEEVFLSRDKKTYVSLSDMSHCVKEAFLAAEDRSFYTHHGVNLGRTLLAAVNTVLPTRPTFGASTITQQVVKNISGDSEPTVRRKLNEILRAFHMEHMHGKDEIFEVYLNIVPMSENMIGIGKAAEVYFGKSAGELSYAEAATLAAIANAPTRYNPYTHPEACLAKRNRVLYAIKDAGYIDDITYRAATEEPLTLSERPTEEGEAMSWFAESVLREVEADLVRVGGMTEEAAHRYVLCGGFSVETTERVDIQRILEDYFADEDHFPPAEGLLYAMCICDSSSGALVATVGRQGEKTASRLINQTELPHTPGSVLKPLALYAPLIDEGRIHAATVFDDVPTEFVRSGDALVPYPRNSPEVYQGLITVADALRLSKNTVAMRLYALRGAEAVYRTLRYEYGIDTLTRSEQTADGRRLSDLSPAPLALGQLTHGATLRRLTEAYTVFPSEGLVHSSYSYLRVRDMTGKTLLEKPIEVHRTMSVGSARVMNQLLLGVTESGTAKGVRLSEVLDTAGKTGTSGGDLDRWFIGYTPYLTAGIWCGYENGTRAVGRHTPSHLSVWNAVMTSVHAPVLGTSDAPRAFSTEGLVRRSFCMDSGQAYMPLCSLDVRGDRLRSAYFTSDNLPEGSCHAHVGVLYDTVTEAIAHEGCPTEDVQPIALIRPPTRSFPINVFITDAQYVFRPVAHGVPLGDSFDRPFFANMLGNGEFCGISQGRKQFNASCYLHDRSDEPSDDTEEDTSS